MIEIKIGSNELVLYKDTSINIEYNNALFGKDTIDGDVTYSFDIPIKGNELALGFEHIPHVNSHRKYDCTINVNGINLVTGKLVVQNVKRKHFAVAVIVNPYPDGWADKSVREDYEEETVIANSYQTYRSEWKTFLASTANEQSNVKFGIFANDENYGNGNEDFGNWKGAELERLVNRLFFNASGNVVEVNDHPHIRIFNQINRLVDDTVEMNQFAFCPQFKLTSVLRKIISSSGYRVGGSFFDNVDLNKIYVQSMVALDGDVYQYFEDSNNRNISLSAYFDAENDPRYQYPVYVWRDNYGYWYYENEGMDAWAEGFGRIYAQERIYRYPLWGQHNQEFGYIPLEKSAGENITCNHGNIIFAIAGKYQVETRIDFPHFIPTGFVKEIPVKIRCKNGQGVILFERHFNISDRNWRFMFLEDITVSNGDIGDIFHISAEIENDSRTHAIPSKGSIHIAFKEYSEDTTLNVFAKSYKENRCLPDVVNSKFINEIRKAVGLTFYADYRSKEIEVDTVADIMLAGTLDLSDYLLINETELKTKENAASFAFGQLNPSNDIPEEKLIDDVAQIRDLPPAKQNCGRICFVIGMNQYYISKKEEDSISNWIYTWKPYCGNTRKVIVGKSKTEDIASDVIVPMIREYAVKNNFGERGTIPDIPASMESAMFESKPSDKIILLYYRGQDILQARERVFLYERMVPYAPNEFSLSPNSMGEQYTKSWLRLYAAERTIHYKFRMPINIVLRTIELLQPQRVSPSNQVRWLMVDNIRTMPKKISFQIDNNEALVLCEIEAAKLD